MRVSDNHVDYLYLTYHEDVPSAEIFAQWQSCWALICFPLHPVQDAPKVLVLQLKRFEYSFSSRQKVSKKVEFQTRLNLAPFMSNPKASRLVSSSPPPPPSDAHSCRPPPMPVRQLDELSEPCFVTVS